MTEAYSHRDITSPMWVLKIFAMMNKEWNDDVAAAGKFVNVLTLQNENSQCSKKTVVELVDL